MVEKIQTEIDILSTYSKNIQRLLFGPDEEFRTLNIESMLVTCKRASFYASADNRSLFQGDVVSRRSLRTEKPRRQRAAGLFLDNFQEL